MTSIDVHLLAKVAAIVTPDGPCPNGVIMGDKGDEKKEATRMWYSLPDPDNNGALLIEFTICSFCVISMHTSWPAIGKAFPFVRASQTACAGTCDIFGGASARTMEHIQLLTVAESQAAENGGHVNMDEFTRFVKRYAGLAECSKGESTEGFYYVMPQIPDFKVCEECYETCVNPYVNTRNSIAERFGKADDAFDGFNCTLYSERMRKAWTDAINNNDMEELKGRVAIRCWKAGELGMQLTAIKGELSSNCSKQGISIR